MGAVTKDTLLGSFSIHFNFFFGLSDFELAKLEMKVTLFLCFTLLCLTTACTSDNDCPGGCCLTSKSKCSKLGGEGDVCDLEGQGLNTNVCGCNAGLKCEKIDLTDFGNIAATVNPIFEKYHYGMCASTILPIG